MEEEENEKINVINPSNIFDFEKMNLTDRYSAQTFFDLLESFTVLQAPPNLPSVEDMEMLSLYEQYNTYIRPTFGILTVSKEFYTALNIKPRTTAKDKNGSEIHFLKDVITLINPLTKKPIYHLRTGKILSAPLSFRAVRVVDSSILPTTTTIILPNGFDYLLEANVALSMKDSGFEFIKKMLDLSTKFAEPSFYKSNVFSTKSSLSVIIDEYLPLIECGSVPTEVWYNSFTKLYEMTKTNNLVVKCILRWLLDRIFGDLLRKMVEISPQSDSHPFLTTDRFTARDLFNIHNFSTLNKKSIPISIEADKMINRNLVLVQEYQLNKCTKGPSVNFLSKWQLPQQIFFAKHCSFLFKNDFTFVIEWIKKILWKIITFYSSEQEELYWFRVLDNLYDLIEILLEHLNVFVPDNHIDEHVSCLVEEIIQLSKNPLTGILLRVFKGNSHLLLPPTLELNQHLIDLYYCGNTELDPLASSHFNYEATLSIGALIRKSFDKNVDNLSLIESSLYEVITHLEIKDPTIFLERFNIEFSNFHCILSNFRYCLAFPSLCLWRNEIAEHSNIEATDDLFEEDVLFIKKRGKIILSDRFLFSIMMQGQSTSMKGITCFGILFCTAKEICFADPKSWKKSLKQLVKLVNSNINGRKWGVVCASQVLRECHFNGVDCELLPVKDLYSYRFMRKTMALDIRGGNLVLSTDQVNEFILSRKKISIPINLKEWSKLPGTSICAQYDFDRYCREHEFFFACVGHLMFGIPPTLLCLETSEDSTLFELSTYLEYSLVRYHEFLFKSPNSIDQKFKIRFVDKGIEEYEILCLHSERKKIRKPLMTNLFDK